MPDHYLTVNVPLSNEKLNALVEFAVDYDITAEQMASQVVQQWVTTLVPKRPYSYVSRETD
jgi:hypothetical protein